MVCKAPLLDLNKY